MFEFFISIILFNNIAVKVRKSAQNRNRYNQVPHLTWIPHRKVTKTQLNITHKCQEVSPFPAADYKAAMNRRESMTNTTYINNTNVPIKKYRLGTVSKNILLEGLSKFHGANLTLNSNVDQDTFGKVTKHTQENTTHTTAKGSALSQQVTTRL